MTESSDQRVVGGAAVAVGVPLATASSFVLHAPLEVLARAALLPLVAPDARGAARARITAVGEEYAASGPPLPAPEPEEFASLEQAAAARTDAAAVWLGAHARPDQLPGLLGDWFLPSLEAAGHANIYLSLLIRYQPRGLPGGHMLRHPVHAVTSGSGRQITLPGKVATGDALAVLAAIDSGPRPASTYIAPLVLHAESHGVFEGLVGHHGNPFELQRFAAQARLQGPAESAPYGWTHALTLAQAPLLLARRGVDPQRAAFVAAAYLAAHWFGEGDGHVDLAYEPEPTGVAFAEALRSDPATAAAVAYHTPPGPAVAAVVEELVTSASVHHDAHRVKYTLACLDAFTTDQPAQRLYLAAAAYLNAWWETH